MQWLRDRIHFGWVGGAALAMTLAYVATGTPTLLASNAANAVSEPSIPAITEPPRPVTIDATTAAPRAEVDPPSLPDVSGTVDDAQQQAEQAREDAEQQSEESQQDADQQRADAEKQAEQSRKDAEQQKADAQRQADEARDQANNH